MQCFICCLTLRFGIRPIRAPLFVPLGGPGLRPTAVAPNSLLRFGLHILPQCCAFFCLQLNLGVLNTFVLCLTQQKCNINAYVNQPQRSFPIHNARGWRKVNNNYRCKLFFSHTDRILDSLLSKAFYSKHSENYPETFTAFFAKCQRYDLVFFLRTLNAVNVTFIRLFYSPDFFSF